MVKSPIIIRHRHNKWSNQQYQHVFRSKRPLVKNTVKNSVSDQTFTLIYFSWKINCPLNKVSSKDRRSLITFYMNAKLNDRLLLIATNKHPVEFERKPSFIYAILTALLEQIKQRFVSYVMEAHIVYFLRNGVTFAFKANIY